MLLTPPARGVHKELRGRGGTQRGQMSTADPRNIPDHNVKPEKKEEVGDIWSGDDCPVTMPGCPGHG